jgi:hypothetical protein
MKNKSPFDSEKCLECIWMRQEEPFHCPIFHIDIDNINIKNCTIGLIKT